MPDGKTTNYGFGWTINYFHGLSFIEHAGGIQGFSSDGIRIPSRQLYIVILSNANPPWPPAISTTIALHMLGQNLAKPASVYIDKKSLENYTGVYTMHRIGVTISANLTNEKMYQYFSAKDDVLFVQPPVYSKAALMNIGKDLFADASGGQYYRFHRNEKDSIISVEIYNEPVQWGPPELELKTDLPLPKEKQAVILAIEKLELIKGKYDFGGGIIIPITIDADKIYMAMPGGEKEEIFAENETNFFSKKTDVIIEFIKGKGKVSGMSVKMQGTKFEGKKIE